MSVAIAFAMFIAAEATFLGGADAALFQQATAETPMARVVKLIADLKAKVLVDGEKEQKSFDKYACWCEKTLERKAATPQNIANIPLAQRGCWPHVGN